jgi:hydrogenase maturation protease
LGLGNPIVSDDSVGFRVIEQLKARFDKPGLTFVESSASGLRLLEVITGYDKLIIIDAIQTKDGQAGEIYRFTPGDFVDTCHSTSPHSVNLVTAIELGKKLGEPLPQQIVIFAIEVADVANFSDRCTPKVEKAIPLAMGMVVKELDNG